YSPHDSLTIFNTSISWKLKLPKPLPVAFPKASFTANQPAKYSIFRLNFVRLSYACRSLTVKIRLMKRLFFITAYLIRFNSIMSTPIPIIIYYYHTDIFTDQQLY